jgi:hypothetical protein
MSIAPGRHTPVLFSLFPLKRPAPVLLRSRALGYGQNSHQRRSVPFLSPHQRTGAMRTSENSSSTHSDEYANEQVRLDAFVVFN